jgi:hypothetical protein
LVNEEGSEDESEDDDADEKKSVSPRAPSVNTSEEGLAPQAAVISEINGIKTHLSSMDAAVDDKWKKQVEGRLLSVEKAIIMLQHKKAEPVKTKGNSSWILLAILLLVIVYLLRKG